MRRSVIRHRGGLRGAGRSRKIFLAFPVVVARPSAFFANWWVSSPLRFIQTQHKDTGP